MIATADFAAVSSCAHPSHAGRSAEPSAARAGRVGGCERRPSSSCTPLPSAAPAHRLGAENPPAAHQHTALSRAVTRWPAPQACWEGARAVSGGAAARYRRPAPTLELASSWAHPGREGSIFEPFHNFPPSYRARVCSHVSGSVPRRVLRREVPNLKFRPHLDAPAAQPCPQPVT